jgi:hypothetical protein
MAAHRIVGIIDARELGEPLGCRAVALGSGDAGPYVAGQMPMGAARRAQFEFSFANAFRVAMR